MNQWNRIFWGFFIFIGLVIVIGTLLKVAYLEILFGLIVIILGIQKLGEEIRSREVDENQKKMSRNMDYLTHWTNATYDYIKNMKQKHEYRLYHLDKKRAEMESKLDESYRDFARKLLELENRMNELAYTGVIAQRPEVRSGRGTDPKVNLSMVSRNIPVPKPLSERVVEVNRKETAKKPAEENRLADLSERQIGAIKVIRSKGKMSTKEYVNLLKVSDRTAQNDLKDMMKKSLIRRAGEGARTHYEMAF
jgi:superfamily II RNA helicase